VTAASRALDPDEVAAEVGRLRSEEEIVRYLDADTRLNATSLRKIATKLNMAIPGNIENRRAIQVHVAQRMLADRSRWSWRWLASDGVGHRQSIDRTHGASERDGCADGDGANPGDYRSSDQEQHGLWRLDALGYWATRASDTDQIPTVSFKINYNAHRLGVDGAHRVPRRPAADVDRMRRGRAEGGTPQGCARAHHVPRMRRRLSANGRKHVWS
jgi:hypothetical protein